MIVSPSGSKVSGGLVALIVLLSVGLAVILFISARWCFRSFRSETRELVEPGFTMEEDPSEKPTENENRYSQLSKRSSVAPTIYEGTYANAESNEFVIVVPPTPRIPNKDDGEELGLLAANPGPSDAHHSSDSIPNHQL